MCVHPLVASSLMAGMYNTVPSQTLLDSTKMVGHLGEGFARHNEVDPGSASHGCTRKTINDIEAWCSKTSCLYIRSITPYPTPNPSRRNMTVHSPPSQGYAKLTLLAILYKRAGVKATCEQRQLMETGTVLATTFEPATASLSSSKSLSFKCS